MRKQTKVWKTVDGREIRICDMDDNHLNNVIALLDRYKSAKISHLIKAGHEALLSLQGEMAIDSIERDLENLMDFGLTLDEVHPLFKTLILEQERRQAMNEKDTTQDDKEVIVNWTFFIAGVQHHQMHKILDQLSVDDFLVLVPEPSNKYDPNAVRIEKVRMSGEDVMCGYVPRKFSAEVSALIEIGTLLECKISEFDKAAKPWEQCKVEIREVRNGKDY